MSEFHVAIVGGCMSHQAGIPFNSLYHRQLAREVQAREGIDLRTHIARAHDLDYIGRVDSLLARRPIDGVLIHIRVMIMKRTRLLIGGRGGRLGYALHPALFSRTHRGRAVEQLRAVELADPRAGVARAVPRSRRYTRRAGARIDGVRIRDLNSAFGALLGLDRWAVDDEILRLTDFVAHCRSRGLPIFVLGPTPLSTTRWQARTIRLLNERLGPYCNAQGLPLALIETSPDLVGTVLEPDGVHLTVAGHGLVKRRLLDAGFGDWVRQPAAAALFRPQLEPALSSSTAD